MPKTFSTEFAKSGHPTASFVCFSAINIAIVLQTNLGEPAMNWNKANTSTKRAYARMWQIHLLGLFSLIPFGLSYVFGQLTGLDATVYVLGAQAILILLIFLRPKFMAFIRAKFRLLSQYAITLILLGWLLYSIAIIESAIRGAPYTLTSFGWALNVAGMLAIFISGLGTYVQAFADLFDLY